MIGVLSGKSLPTRSAGNALPRLSDIQKQHDLVEGSKILAPLDVCQGLTVEVLSGTCVTQLYGKNIAVPAGTFL